MNIVLENDILRVTISPHGAEMHSIFHKAHNREYLWGGNPDVWARHSPVLFPYCGRVLENKYIFDDKEYPAKAHGFNRDLPHTLVSNSDSEACFVLENNSETEKYYPYSFKFYTTYILNGSRVDCVQKVENTHATDIQFSVGYHTAIPIPFVENTIGTDYFIDFEKKENCTRLFAQDPGFIIPNADKPYQPERKTIDLHANIFFDSLLLESATSEYIDIKCKKSENFVRIGGTNSPNTVFWTSPENGLDLICIEPWYGKPDYLDTDHIFKNKRGILHLSPTDTFQCSQYIEIFDK